jgi:hypothetical protein
MNQHLANESIFIFWLQDITRSSELEFLGPWSARGHLVQPSGSVEALVTIVDIIP